MIMTLALFPEPLPLFAITRQKYDEIVGMGILEDERVELLNGVIVPMSPQGTRHSGVVQLLTMWLAPALIGRAAVRPRLPFAASDLSEPEPDLAVVGQELDVFADHPGSALLLVEVSSTSQAKDLGLKARL